MDLVRLVKAQVKEALLSLYDLNAENSQIVIQETKPEFQGDYTLVTFSLAKHTGRRPDDLAEAIGAWLMDNQTEAFKSYNVIKGFLNLEISNLLLTRFLHEAVQTPHFGEGSTGGQKVMIEYSSPNTNKPLHFGHLRNIFLGYAVARIEAANGHQVIKANLINDRGIHICKSMVAWKHFANGATPQSTGIKGDHLVGDYYVRYNEAFKKQVEQAVEQGMNREEAEKKAPILLEAQELLRLWESGDEETLQLWKQMNAWVYAGFDQTYKRLGVSFDKYYYESETYLLGKTLVEKGLASGVLFRKEDQSVWIDLTADGLDQKLLLRADGTSVYMTQDMGTASLKYQDYQMDQSVYVIGDEQNYHMQVLKLIMQKLQAPGADGIFHLSYGMVELPTGRMKSREGTVVDADDMLDEMQKLAKENTEALGKTDDFSEQEKQELFATLGLGALKFYLLRVDPKKKMIFNPQESIDFHGFTGPFIQYTHARISSILRKSESTENPGNLESVSLSPEERQLCLQLEQYPAIVRQAGESFNPSLICNYLHSLAKTFNHFLVDHPVLKAEESHRNLRLALCRLTRRVLSHGLGLLGIQAPERM